MAAETDVNVFGRAHLSLDHLDNSEESSQFLNTNSSRIGVSSATELRDGLTAEAQYIARVALSYGAGGNRDQDLIVGSRESYLGLAGDFGVVRAGRITAPMQVHMDRFQMFGDQIGDAGVFLGGGGLVDRYGNVVAYSTSDWWSAAEPYRFTVGFIPAGGEEKDPGVLMGFDYESGPLLLGVSANYFGKDSDDLDDLDVNQSDMMGAQLLGSYDLGESRVMGAVQYSSNRNGVEQDGDDMVVVAGVSRNLNPDTVIKAHAMQYVADADDSDSTLVALGVDHFLSAQMRVYVATAMTTNDDASDRTAWGWGHGDVSNPGTPGGVAGETATAFSVGARYDF
jgi:predicted porin